MKPRDIPSYATMAEFYAALGGRMDQEVDLTVHRLEAIHRNAPFRSPLFRANYYSIVLVRRGRGRYFLDDHTAEIRDRTLYFTNPGHIKGFEIVQPSQGYVLTFAESFLKEYLGPGVLEEFPFLISEVVPPSYLPADAFAPFETLGAALLEEFDGASTYRFKIIGNLMAVLLLRIKEGPWKGYDPAEEGRGASRLVHAFKQNLEAHFRDLREGRVESLHQVQDFARLQHLHPNYLGTVIRQKTGKTILAWVAEKRTAEASALLARSNLSIKEIAFRLGFTEPGHFSRFFKEQTGRTPSAHRRAAAEGP
ncbi:MAG: AraC family transcriptional regulator [Holophagaceae bacterium]